MNPSSLVLLAVLAQPANERAPATTDPFLALGELLAASIPGLLAEPPDRGPLERARAYVERLAADSRGEALAGVLRRFEALDRAGLEAEARVRERLELAIAARKAGRWADVLPLAKPGEADLAPGTLTGARLELLGAEALERLGRSPEAAAAYRQAAARAAAIGWKRAEGEAKCRVVRLERKPAEALQCLTRLREELLAAGDRAGAADALEAIGQAWREQGNRPAALEAYRGVQAGRRELGDVPGLVSIQASLGSLLYEIGNFAEALAELEPALEAQAAAGNRLGAARTRFCLGGSLKGLGDHESGLRHIQEALRELESLGASERRAEMLVALGNLHFTMQEYAPALDAFEQALELNQTVRSPSVERRALGGLTGTSYELGQLETARRWLTRALEREPDDAQLLLTLGHVCFRLKDRDSARRHLAQALEVLPKERSDKVAQVFANAATVHAELGDRERAVELLREALEMTGDRGLRASFESQLARLLKDAGKPGEAREMVERLIPVLEKAGDRVGIASARRLLVEVLLALGEAGGALAEARKVVELRLGFGAGLGEEQLLGLRQQAWFDSEFGLEAALQVRRPVEAFWFLEMGRGLALAGALREGEKLRVVALPPELREADERTRRVVREKEQAWRELALDPSAPPGKLEEAERAAEEARRDRGALVARLARRARKAIDSRPIAPVALEPVQRALAPETALVLYHVGTRRSVALVVDRETARLVELAAPEPVRKAAEAFVRVARTPESDVAVQAVAAYDLLLRPLEEALAGKQRLMIGPDGPLALVPFEALLRREGDATRMALERWEIAYVPSATVLAALREGPGAAPRGQGVVALGDPERRAPGGETARRDEKGPLPATADEAKAIGALFPEEARVVLLGAEATRSALRAALERPDGGRLRALHLACHAEIDLAVPGRSALILAGGERLELDDVYGWRVPSDLTVLSACATGVGPERQGEGILGLARGFFLAGSPRVVVTNWRVADRSSCALMTAFYERMIRDGLPAAAALREAKRALAAPGGPLAHPFHWAGFVLWGLPD